MHGSDREPWTIRQGLGHGTRHGHTKAAYDLLTFDLGEQVRDVLKAAGYPLTWHAYAMAHQVCMEELVHIGAWLREVFALS